VNVGSNIRDKARERLGKSAGLVDDLAPCVNLDWYLQHKILEPDERACRNHKRVLVFARAFHEKRAGVTFVRETDSRTPDLLVETGSYRFYLEVTNRIGGKDPPHHPDETIVGIVQKKRDQLPPDAPGFVAISNFDLGLEWRDGSGITDEHLATAICEIVRLASAEPDRWSTLAGLIFCSATSGVLTGLPGPVSELRLPIYLWANQRRLPPLDEGLFQWMIEALGAKRWTWRASACTAQASDSTPPSLWEPPCPRCSYSTPMPPLP